MSNYTKRTDAKERIIKSDVLKGFDVKSVVFLGRAYNDLGNFHSQSYLVTAIQKCMYCDDIPRVYEVTLYEEDNKMAFVPMTTVYNDTEWERSDCEE